jgi:hypothetical protein
MFTKEISVKDLPAGYFKDRLTEFVLDTQSTVKVVAVNGAVGDWAAYIGWPEFDALKPHYQTDDFAYNCTMTGGFDQVADHGDKLSCEEASAIFTALKPERYRH